MPSGYDYFISAGWSPAQSAGIMGNLFYESGGLNPTAVGDGGLAYGLAQWHPDRQANFERVMGFPIQGSSVMDQYKFVNWELNNTERGAGNLLRQATNIGDATAIFMSKYERPANSSSFSSRLDQAKKFLTGTIKDKIGEAARMGISTIPGGSLVMDALDFGGINPLGGGGKSWLEQLKDWIINSGFFQRLALAIIAFIVLLAAFYLMKDNVIESVVSKVKG